MGSSGQPLGIMFGRHDPEDLVHATGHVCARSAGPLEGDLHDQVVADGARYPESQHEPHTCIGQFRLDGPPVGRGEGRLYTHSYEAY